MARTIGSGRDLPHLPSNVLGIRSVYHILEFLQLGLEKGLGASTLKVQVSALSAMMGTRWALDPLIVQFLKACIKIRPPRKPVFPTWDLSTVLEALSKEPFFPLESISLWDLTLKLSFLIAIMSAKRVSEIHALLIKEPHLVLYPDRVVLRPSEQFIPKVASSFLFNSEINLPVFRSNKGHPHTLYVKSTIVSYLKATEPFRKVENLVVISHGPRKGQAASPRTIATWLIKIIKRTYIIQSLPILDGLKAHSTRAVATSWAVYCRVSAETICKAATWSSKTTFMSHYRIDPAQLTTV